MNINDTVTLEKDRYTLIEKQVGGAQAEVFKVRRESDKHILALKIARIWKDTDQLWPVSRVKSNCHRIQQEIEFLQSLQQAEAHYIVACLDQGILQEGGRDVPAFIMPFYQQSLSSRLFEQQPNLRQCLIWIKQLIIALKYIHHHKKDGKALMHRDLKLDNLMLNEQNEIRLLDFGISKNVFKRADSTHTQMNYSDDCVAPEQVLLIKPNTDGKKHVAIGTHTDIYALGLLIYRIIAGYLPESQEDFISDLEQISYRHKAALDKGEAGLLGKVGGITTEEIQFLAQTFIDLAENRAMTFIYEDELEDTGSASIYSELAEQFAEFVAELLDKHYQERPNAKNALHWIENIQFKLSQLTPSQSTVSTDSSTVKTSIKTTSDLPQESTAKPKPVTQTVSKVSNPTAKPARIEPDLSTQPAASEPISTTNTVSAKPSKLVNNTAIPIKKILVGIVISLIVLFVVVHYAKRPVSPEDVNNPSPQLSNHNNSVDTEIQALDTALHGNDQQQWKAALIRLKAPEYSNNSSALALLAHAYEQGKAVTRHWGKAWLYYQQALQYGDNKAIAQQKHNLEVKADTILSNPQSTRTQRDKAYQVIETVAKRTLIPLSINARLWMEYRYRKGDGVDIDITRANEWKRKYNQIKDK